MNTRWSGAMACLLAVVGWGCGPDAATLARAGVDPAGTYEFVLVDDGERIPGSMEITGVAGDYTGRIRAEGRPEAMISTVTTGGDQVTITADFPGMVLLVRLEFDGEAFTGDWMLRNEGGPVEGRRVAG